VTGAELVCALPRAECVRRLKAAIDSEWTFFATAEAIGRVRDDAFHIRKRVWFRNAYRPVMRARMEDGGGGTVLHCRFGVSWPAIAWTVIWYGVLAAMTVAMIAGTHKGDVHGWEDLSFLFYLLVFGVGPVAIGRYLARGERQFLTAFVGAEIEARETASPV
jgi:hypothetical protein